jgi:hypothetical protein
VTLKSRGQHGICFQVGCGESEDTDGLGTPVKVKKMKVTKTTGRRMR